MASGEAEPLQYTTTVLRVSIHCEGCKKKVKKVLHSIEGVYKVTVDAAQHKVTVTASLGADALIRRLHKAGKQAALWPAPAAAAPVAEAKKPKQDEAATPVLPVAAGESCAKEAKEDAKPKEERPPPEAERTKEKKPAAAKEKKAEKGEAATTKPKDEATDTSKDAEAAVEAKDKGAPSPAAEEVPSSGKKGKKSKKNKHKDGGEGEAAPAAAAGEKPPLQAPAPSLGLERPHGAFPYYAAAQPVMSYNVAHPSSSVSYYAPTPVVPMPPPTAPPPPYPAMLPPPMPMPMPEFLYGPPGMRSSWPPQEPYNNMFNEENANSCSLM